jgi:hypothetical protein
MGDHRRVSGRLLERASHGASTVARWCAAKGSVALNAYSLERCSASVTGVGAAEYALGGLAVNTSSLLVAIGIVAALGCGPAHDVSSSLESAVNNASSGARVAFRDLTEFDWNHAVVLAPYTTREQAEEILGFSWPEFDHTGIEMHDSFVVLVFAASDSVVHSEAHPRCKPDFHESARGRRFTLESAVFQLETKGHCPVLRPVAESDE